MSNPVLRVRADSDGWYANWTIDDRLIDKPVFLSDLDVCDHLSDFRELDQRFSRVNENGRLVRPHCASSELKALGQNLFERWCKPVWDQAFKQLHGTAHLLLIQSVLPEILNLPWELLPLGVCGEAIGCDPAWGLYRCPLPELLPGNNNKPPGPLRVLFLAAAPEGQPMLDHEREEEAILDAVTNASSEVSLYRSESGSWDELRRLVGQLRPHVLHLSGHARVNGDGQGVFCFEDKDFRADEKTAESLVLEVLRSAQVQCVFLSGCETSLAAESGLCQKLVAAGLPLALGWAARVADDRATTFSEEFYLQLSLGRPVAAAVAHARLRVRRTGVRQVVPTAQEELDSSFVLPRLYCSTLAQTLFDAGVELKPPKGPKTKYAKLHGRVEGLRRGFVNYRRFMHEVVLQLRQGDIGVAVVHGLPGAGKSTVATRIANRLEDSGYRSVVVSCRQTDPQDPRECGLQSVKDIFDSVQTVFLAQEMSNVYNTLVDRTKPLRTRLDLLGSI